MGKLAFVFSGQGAQKTGMGKSFYDECPASRAVFDIAGEEITRLCFEGSGEILAQTVNTQPCVFCADLAAAYALSAEGLVPDAAAGFSLGEIPALAFANVLTIQNAFELVCKRGELMDFCAKKTAGFMAAVMRITPTQVEEACKMAGVYAANYNCDTQIVVSGEAKRAKTFFDAVRTLGGRAVPLAVSGAFHTPYMEEASGLLYDYMAKFEFHKSSFPLYSNVTALPYQQGEERKLLSRQVCSPVLWQKTIENMAADGFDTFIEVGVGNTLSTLIGRILPDAKTFCVTSTKERDECLKERLR
ncbi:MAG: ACP S-malonyltransferase [Clostridia bacterium]|nr:ACP S-malonyltransferase [Clostridia bacterium]